MLGSLRDAIGRLLRKRKGPGSPTRAEVGARGERLAARHLKRQGYRILARNFATDRGEVDIVAFRDGVVAFVEVRSQTEPVLIDPEATVTRAKQLRVIAAAKEYCALHELENRGVALRLDVITIRFSGRADVDLRHIENAFQVTARGF